MAKLMTAMEVARHLRVNRKTIYNLLHLGEIPATRIGHQWRFDRAAIDEWLQQKSVGREVGILVIDDEDVVRLLFKETLEQLGHKVTTAEDGSKGVALVNRQDFDMVFLDLKMPGMDGADAFRQIRALKPKLPVIIITGYPESDVMARALAGGPFGIMKKPFSAHEVVTAVNSFLQLPQQGGLGRVA